MQLGRFFRERVSENVGRRGPPADLWDGAWGAAGHGGRCTLRRGPGETAYASELDPARGVVLSRVEDASGGPCVTRASTAGGMLSYMDASRSSSAMDHRGKWGVQSEPKNRTHPARTTGPAEDELSVRTAREPAQENIQALLVVPWSDDRVLRSDYSGIYRLRPVRQCTMPESGA